MIIIACNWTAKMLDFSLYLKTEIGWDLIEIVIVFKDNTFYYVQGNSFS